MTIPQAPGPATAAPDCRRMGCELPAHSSPSRTFGHCVEHLADNERVLATSDYAHHRTTPYTYGTAFTTVKVESSAPDGPVRRRIGPVHAILGRTIGPNRTALCGAYVTNDEPLPWPPEASDDRRLCRDCTELAAST